MLTKDLGSVPSTHIVAHRRAGDTHMYTQKYSHTENQTKLIIMMMIIIIRRRIENFEGRRSRGLSLLAGVSDQGCLFRVSKGVNMHHARALEAEHVDAPQCRAW